MTLRQERWNELLRRLAANFIERESNRDALISVTRVELNEKLDHATIFISVLPESKEEASLHFIERQLTDMRTYIKKNVSGRVLPYLHVKIDYGEKNRQIVDQIDTTK